MRAQSAKRFARLEPAPRALVVRPGVAAEGEGEREKRENCDGDDEDHVSMIGTEID